MVRMPSRDTSSSVSKLFEWLKEVTCFGILLARPIRHGGGDVGRDCLPPRSAGTFASGFFEGASVRQP